MTEDRIHRAVSADGTEIVGRVCGQGPPVVMVHGGWGDGEVAWEAMLPQLTDRFTCYTPSTRGRGLSGDKPDHSPPRLVEDVIAFVDSIGAPVCLVGWSGVEPVLGAAAREDSVAGVALYEPAVVSMLAEDDMGRLGSTLERVGAAAADGRLTDAARAFATWIMTDDELSTVDSGFYERWARSVPAMLHMFQHDLPYEGPRSTDPEVLAQIAAPVLVLRGQRTLLDTFWAGSEQHIGRHVTDPHVREPLPGVGHLAPAIAPGTIVKELTSFFESARRPA